MKKANASLLLAALLTGVLAQPDALAREQTVYKWVDAEGVVHFTAQPPENGEYEKIGLQTREPTDATAEGETADDDVESTAPEQPEAAASGPDPELVAERCKQARSNIEKLTGSANVLIRGEDGENRVLTEEERQRMLEEAQQFINEWC